MKLSPKLAASSEARARNQRNADRAKQCLRVFADIEDSLLEEDGKELVTDLITNLLHYANANGFNASRCHRLAMQHYRVERDEA